MSERKINLEEIIKLYSLSDTITTRQSFIYFGKQLLELAAENAKINWIENEVKMESDSDFAFRDSDGNWCKISLDEQSILNIINEVE